MIILDKSYSELITFPTFLERFEYLKLSGVVGEKTFGHDRYLNQILYHSERWLKDIRPKVILRDNGNDLAMDGFEIARGERSIVHHINPITVEDILEERAIVFDLENLILTKFITHQAIHYGDKSLLVFDPVERTKYDTCPWRK